MATQTIDNKIHELLGDSAAELLEYRASGFAKEQLHLPGADFVDRVVAASDRSPSVLRNFQSLLNHGRLGGTGYVSILPVDQGIEHSAGASFAPNPIYFDPESIVKLAVEAGCNAVASTLGVLGSVARKYAHKIPFLVKLNHNELLTYPNTFDQILFGHVEQGVRDGRYRRGGRRSTSGPTNPTGRSKRSRPPSPGPMNWAWLPCSGATCVTAGSRKTAPTTTPPPT